MRLYRRLFAEDRPLPHPGGGAAAQQEERRASRKRPRGHPLARHESSNGPLAALSPGLREAAEGAVEATCREGVSASRCRSGFFGKKSVFIYNRFACVWMACRVVTLMRSCCRCVRAVCIYLCVRAGVSAARARAYWVYVC